MPAKVNIENVWFSYEEHGEAVLRNVNIEINDGDVFVIAGQCGCGKSTLTKLMVGLLRPSHGKVLVDQKDINDLSPEALFELRNQIGFVFQTSALISNMTVFNNIALPARYHLSLPKSETEELVSQVVARAGLGAYRDKLPAQLSIGQRKRAAVARALVLNPKLMIYDEPTAGLDPINTLGITDIISDRYNEFQTTSVIVTHNMAFAFSIATRIAIMYRGKVIFVGPVDEFRKSENPFIKEFLRSYPSGAFER